MIFTRCPDETFIKSPGVSDFAVYGVPVVMGKPEDVFTAAEEG